MSRSFIVQGLLVSTPWNVGLVVVVVVGVVKPRRFSSVFRVGFDVIKQMIVMVILGVVVEVRR